MARKPRAYHLAAFDPGERTGFVAVRVAQEFDARTATPSTFWILDQDVLTVRDMPKRLPAIVRLADVVAYETWRLYEKNAQEMIGNDMQPSQVVGMIRYEAWKQKKTLASAGARIKANSVRSMPGWLREHMAKSSEQHDQDAIMHAWATAWKRWQGQELREEGT